MRENFKMKKILFVLSVIVLVGCAGISDKKEVIGEASDLYNQGMEALYAKQYSKAINLFEELDRQHPYSELATKGEVMIIFANFESEDFDETVYEADKFMKENIGYKDLDYVLYMKGLAFYYRISDVKRDQANTIQAMKTFEQLIRRYPQSVYAKDVKQKVKLCYDNLAGKEMEVGRFYQSQGNMLAAINRFQEVVNNYQKSSHTPEALYRIAECYMALGIEDEAVRSLSILGYNYSGGSIWYKKGYDLVRNIDKHEEKYQNQKWYKNFKQGLLDTFTR